MAITSENVEERSFFVGPVGFFFFFFNERLAKMVVRYIGSTQRVALTGSSLAHNESCPIVKTSPVKRWEQNILRHRLDPDSSPSREQASFCVSIA